jgi:hypothetical protein
MLSLRAKTRLDWHKIAMMRAIYLIFRIRDNGIRLDRASAASNKGGVSPNSLAYPIH